MNVGSASSKNGRTDAWYGRIDLTMAAEENLTAELTEQGHHRHFEGLRCMVESLHQAGESSSSDVPCHRMVQVVLQTSARRPSSSALLG